jgi:hypothetical protein
MNLPTPTAFLQAGPAPAAPSDRTHYRSVLIPNERWHPAQELSLPAVACQNPAVAEVDDLKIPKATRCVADGVPGHR